MKNKKENPIDGLFRRKLNEEQLAPDDLLWNEIETKLAEKKPANRFGLWILLGTVLLCAVASYFVFFNHSSINSNGVSEKIIQTEGKISEKEIQLNTISPATENNSHQSNNSTTKNSSSTSSVKSNSNSNSTSSNQISNSLSNNSSNGNKTSSTKKHTSEKSISENKNSLNPLADNSSNEIIIEENPVGKNSDSVTDTKNEKDNSQTEISISKTEPLNEIPLAANSAISGEKKNDEPHTSAQNQNHDNEIINSSDIKTLPDTAAIVKTETPVSVNPNPIVPENKSNWFIEIGSSFMKNSSSISTGETFNTYYLSRRNADEKSINTFNYKVNVGKTINQFQILAGVDLLRFGENIQYDNKGRCYTIAGNPTDGYDTLQIHIQQNNSISEKNSVSKNLYLGIPLKVNYVIPLKTINILFGAGTTAAFPLKWNSYYLNKSVTAIENPGDIKMISGLVFNINASAGLSIPVSEKFDVALLFDYRKNLNSVLKKTYSVNQKYQTMGAGVCLRYNFIKK